MVNEKENGLNIGIAGLGTVGVGVLRILLEKQELFARKTGREIAVRAVSSRDRSKDRGVSLDNMDWYENPVDIAHDDNIDLVVETIGGDSGVAYDLCKAALEGGKHVVTANKALIAKHGNEFAEIAEGQGAALMFEAAVAGGIPIVKALREGLAANNFSRISGILNGTCNYIISGMKQKNREFDDVLAEAQRLGYAETPPDLDIDGIDTAHKLAIITALAYNCRLDFDSVHIGGIRNVSLADIKYADELGYEIRLLGIAKQTESGIEQRVHACLVPKSSVFAQVSGVTNAVLAECDALGPAFFTGAGAGRNPTASSVIADIIDIARGNISPPFGMQVNQLQEAEFIDIKSHTGEYYMRMQVSDEPGVLASITSLFGQQEIGMETVLQKADEQSKTAQIALTTHNTSEIAIKKLLGELENMEYIVETPHIIRIERV